MPASLAEVDSAIARMSRSGPLGTALASRQASFCHEGASGINVRRSLKRRLADAGHPETLRPHSCRVAVATDLLDQKVPLEDVQQLLGNADARSTD